MISKTNTVKRSGHRLPLFVLAVFVLLSVQASATHKSKLQNSTVIAKSAGKAVLKPEGVRVPVELVAAERRLNQTLSARIAKLSPGKSLYLIFKHLQATKQPGELYNVYLNLEEGRKPGKDDRPIGILNFYNARKTTSSPDQFFSFDVTEALKNLAAQQQLSETLTVTIIPLAAPEPGAVPTVGQIELVEQ